MSGEEHDINTLRNADNLHAAAQESCDSGSNNVAKEKEEEEPLAKPRVELEERLIRKMTSHARDIICFLIIAFSTFGALYSPPPKISKPPLARPFFNQSSIVLDFYKGHLGAMVDRVTSSDFSFIMFYAPWDAESQAAREEFEIVAKYYHSQIFFAAINCWHPGSDCRTHYNKIQSYPVLMLYPARDSGVQYKGILTAPYMIRFLDSFMNPIVRISNRIQLTQLLVDYDAAIVGYFNFVGLAKSPGYREFYKSAIRSLERDPNKDLVFAAVTDSNSAESNFGIFNYPTAALFMWNETLIYPSNNDWTSVNLMNWIDNSLHRVTLWLQPPGSKSLTLAPFLWNGPVFFLFTPRNPLYLDNYYYNLLKETGLEYYNCTVNLIGDKILNGLKQKRIKALSQYRSKIKQCSELLAQDKVQQSTPTISISLQNWINDSCCSSIVMNKCLLCEKKDSVFLNANSQICTLSSKNYDKVCKETDVLYTPLKHQDQETHEFCCTNKEELAFNSEQQEENGFSIQEIDLLSTNSIKKHFYHEECRKFLTGNNHRPPDFPKKYKEDESVKLTSVKCRSNKTLSFVAIDSVNYYHFANNLGVDILDKRDKTAVVIVDPSQESQYVMQENLNRLSLVHFINNYMEGVLQRNLRSDNLKRFPNKRKTNNRCKGNDRSRVCIPELTTETFLPTVLDPTKDVVIMYHSSYCAFCSAVGYVFLTIAHYLSQMDGVKFVRVDGDNNDLPWEYSMNRYPAILFFPARRKEDNTVFPFTLSITIPNFMSFVLANLEEDSHVEALINICHLGAGESPVECVSRIRLLCLDAIETYLRKYRKLRRHSFILEKRIFGNERREILVKLEHIRDVHLILGSVNDLEKETKKVEILRQKFRRYYRSISVIRNVKSVEKKVHCTVKNTKNLKDEL